MNRTVTNKMVLSCLLFVSVLFVESNAQTVTSTNIGYFGAGTFDANHRLRVDYSAGIYSTDGYGGGYGPVYVEMNCKNVSNGSQNCTGWSFTGADVGIRGCSNASVSYTAAIGAFSDLSYPLATAFLAASKDGTSNAKLAYKDATSIIWPGYFTTPGANALQYGIAIRNPNSTDAGGSASGILFSVEGSGEFGKGAIVYERKNSYARGSIDFLQEPNATTTNPGLANKVMTITNTGVVGIGIEPSATTTNKLEVQGNAAVKGQISCNSLKVTASISPWPDYVFNKNYQAQSLSETESFIKKNGHLPGMPSAKEVATNGIDVGVMQANLLKSMEEMTLQMIEQNKKIERLTKENEELNRKIAQRN